MNTLRILSPAIAGTILALPLLAEDHKPDQSAPPRANVPAHVVSGAMKSNLPLGPVTRVSDVIGLEVRNLQDENLGKVSDLALDVASGHIVEVIVSTGGVLGVGATLIGVPPAAFHYDHTTRVLHLDRTKESLKSLPEFDLTQWEANFQPANVVEVYREYGVTPYFDADAVAADNTGLNRRDRDRTTLTPEDQGTSTTDIAITTRIRRAVLDHDELSINARNVKIITRNGRVTLRGPVNSDAEARAIVEIAESVVEPSSVNNQLEVVRDAIRD